MNFHGVLFDMDGLLLDTERLVVEAFQQTVSDFDLPDLSDVMLAMIGLRSDAGDKLLRAALVDLMDHGQFDTRWHEHIMATFENGIPVKTGVVDVLEQLSRAGLPCAVATSTKTANAEIHLQQAGIDGYFRTVTGGDQVHSGKPAPDIYHMAANNIGLNAADCAAFEDSDPGTTAAIQSGATTVQVPDLKQPSPDTRKLGHVIAADIVTGAKLIGLI